MRNRAEDRLNQEADSSLFKTNYFQNFLAALNSDQKELVQALNFASEKEIAKKIRENPELDFLKDADFELTPTRTLESFKYFYNDYEDYLLKHQDRLDLLQKHGLLLVDLEHLKILAHATEADFKALQGTQGELAEVLAEAFDNGDEDTPRDRRKAHNLRAAKEPKAYDKTRTLWYKKARTAYLQKLVKTTKLQGEASNAEAENEAENLHEETARLTQEKITNRKSYNDRSNSWWGWFKDLFSSQNLYERLGWFTSFRLFLLRSHRISAMNGKKFLPEFYKFFGLSYGLELIADFVVIIKSVFFNEFSEREKTLPRWKVYWQRFKNVIQKDNRPYRMSNAAVWFGINLALLFITGGLSIYLNLATFVFDVGLELVKAGLEQYKFYKTRKALKTQIDEIDQAIQKTENQEDKDKLLSQKRQFQLLDVKLQRQAKAKLNDRLYDISMVVLILVGMVLLASFPPVSVPAMIGATVAFACGSLLFGFGRRLLNTYRARVKDSKDAIEEVEAVKKDVELEIAEKAKKENPALDKAAKNAPQAIIPIPPDVNQSHKRNNGNLDGGQMGVINLMAAGAKEEIENRNQQATAITIISSEQPPIPNPDNNTFQTVVPEPNFNIRSGTIASTSSTSADVGNIEPATDIPPRVARNSSMGGLPRTNRRLSTTNIIAVVEDPNSGVMGGTGASADDYQQTNGAHESPYVSSATRPISINDTNLASNSSKPSTTSRSYLGTSSILYSRSPRSCSPIPSPADEFLNRENHFTIISTK